MQEKRFCFVALPFSPTPSMPDDGGWPTFFEVYIKPAVETYAPRDGGLFFNCNLQETLQDPWIHEITDKLLTAELVIADLTDLNPNVCIELGVRLASGLPVVRISSTSTDRLGNLAGYGIMLYSSDMSQKAFAAELHRHMDQVLSGNRSMTWLSQARQLLARRVQDVHTRAFDNLLTKSSVGIELEGRVEDGYFFYSQKRFFRYWRQPGEELSVGIEPSVFFGSFSTWPFAARPLRHTAWPLILPGDIDRLDAWLSDCAIEVYLGEEAGGMRLDISLAPDTFNEELMNGSRLTVPRVMGRVEVPGSQSEMILTICFRGLFHPVSIPRILCYPDGFVSGLWSVTVDARNSDLGCSVMPILDRSQAFVSRGPYDRQISFLEVSPRAGSTLLPTDGALVTFFPKDARGML